MMTKLDKTEMETMIQLVNDGITDADLFMKTYKERCNVTRSSGAFGLYLTTLIRCNILETTDSLQQLLSNLSKLTHRAKMERRRARTGTNNKRSERHQALPTGGSWISAANLSKILATKDVSYFAKQHNIRRAANGNRGLYHIDDLQATMAKCAQEAIDLAQQWHDRIKTLKATASVAVRNTVSDTIMNAANLTSTPSAQFLMECVRSGKLTPVEAAKLLQK